MTNINVPFNALSGLQKSSKELQEIARHYADQGNEVAGPLKQVCQSLQNLPV